MPAIKKLSIAPFFLIGVSLLNYYLVDLFKTSDILFSIQLHILIQFGMICALLLLTSLLFILLVSIAANWIFIIPILLVSASIPVIFFSVPLGLFLAAGFSVVYLVTFFMLEQKLRTYINFQPTTLLGPSINSLSGWLILIISFAYFLNLNIEFKNKPFQIPDSLIENAMKFAPLPTELNQETTGGELNSVAPENLGVTSEQIQFLRQHPEALKQSGLDPKILDSVEQALAQSKTNGTSSPTFTTNDLIKQTLKDQLQKIIQPYTSFIPAGLAGILFITLKSISSLLSFAISPILWIIFYIFEKTGFIHYENEMREVKKMIV